MNIIVKAFGTGRFYCRPDTTWEREDKDLYLPDAVTGYLWTPVLFARISKAGKCIGRKFADRYYDAVSYGILLYVKDLLCPAEQNAPEAISLAAASCTDHTSVLPFPMYNKVTLEDGTNIFSVFPVAEHILALDIDERLDNADPTLVQDIASVTISNKAKNFYSFASKYCSHHRPDDYPIYDSYVDTVLRYFRKTDRFAKFNNADLKHYPTFKSILLDFSAHYGLTKYGLKDLDRYLWQLGKHYFQKTY